MTNICSEITLHTDENHSFVCCLSSLNLAKYEEWKGTNLIYDATYGFSMALWRNLFKEPKDLRGFENAVRSATKRDEHLGLGVLGWHTYLQEKRPSF